MYEEFEGLPDRRTSLVGLEYGGVEVRLLRGVSQKLYRCPGCGGAVEVGAEHVIVQKAERGGRREHQHWHRACAEDKVLLGLRQVRRVRA